MDIEEVLEFADHLIFAMTGKHLDSLQQAILRGAWENHKYREIAEAHHRSEVYVKEVGFKLWQALSDIFGETVNKGNFRSVLERRWRFFYFLPFWKAFVQKNEVGNDWESLEISQPSDRDLWHELETPLNISSLSLLPFPENIPCQDLSEAPEISACYGRQDELSLLENWIVNDRSPLSPLENAGTGSRLIALLGISGIGKTTLAVKLVDQIKDKFHYVIWRNLRSAPTVELLQQSIRQFVSNYPISSLGENRRRSVTESHRKDSISELLELCRQFRCLVILDDVEMLFGSGKLAGYYRIGYEDYGCLFKQVAELSHQSCFLLISSELPKEIAELESTNQYCQSLHLHGLSLAPARELLIQQGLIPDRHWDKLIHQYQGNPLWLKIVATMITDLFGGNVGELFDYEPLFLPEDLQLRLQQQCDRLSELEQQVIAALAAESESLSLAKLRDILPISPANLPDAMQSLIRRFWITKETAKKITRFALQPVMRQYFNRKYEKIYQFIE
jgi:hypothetical protein